MTEPTRLNRPDRAALVRDTVRLLAVLAEADPTVSGATLILPDGTMQFVSVADALAMAGSGPARGRA